jgi:hypothetical protein
MFRQVGGSIGVAVFGAIFANRVHADLAARVPPGTHMPKTANPDVIRHLPPLVHAAFEQAFAAALHPVFLAAGGVAAVAFALTWLLRDVPLRTQARAGEAIPAPRDEERAAEASA